MKRFFLLLFSAVAVSVAVHAQDSTTAHHQHDRDRGSAIRHQRMDMMQQLNLTDEQKTKMQKLREEQKAKTDAIRNSNVSDDEKSAQLKSLRADQRKSMEDILTPEQKSKMQAMRKEQMKGKHVQKQDADSTQK